MCSDRSSAKETAAPLAATAGVVFGGVGSTIILIGALISTFGYLSGDALTSPRALFALSEQGMLPPWLSKVHPTRRTPWLAIMTHATLAFTLASTGSFVTLIVVANVAVLLMYGVVCVGVLALRAKGVRGAGDPFVVPGGPVVPVLAAAVLVGAALDGDGAGVGGDGDHAGTRDDPLRGVQRDAPARSRRSPGSLMIDPLLAFRPEFPILAKTNYLVSNSLGAMPRAAADRLAEYARTWSERGVRAWADGWWNMPVTVGDEIAPLIGAGAGEIAMMPNVSLAHATILSALDFKPPRDTIVMTALDFPSVRYVVEQLAPRLGARRGDRAER